MSEIEQKALALVNEVAAERGEIPCYEIWRNELATDEALCRAIEQNEADKAAHAATVEGILKGYEAYKQDVSDAVKSYLSGSRSSCILDRFILPKPDPLVEALNAMWRPLGVEPNVCEDEFDANDAAQLRRALAKRGLKDRGGRMTEITQADHNAAEEHFDLWNPNTAWGYEPLVEAFARHRQQSTEALQAENARLRWEAATGRTIDEQRANLSQAMRDTGDCKLIWVNEGDLLVAALQETER